MTELHKLLAATANFCITLQAHLLQDAEASWGDSDTDAIMTAANNAQTTMATLAAYSAMQNTAGELDDQTNFLIAAAQNALFAANEEDGTHEMAGSAVTLLKLAHDNIAH